MKKEKVLLKMKEFFMPSIIIFVAVVLRLLPHPANVAPITALALFGGTYLNKRFAFIVPLVALFISDIFIGFHSTMFFVYASFLISGFLGVWLKKRKAIANTVVVTFLASMQFFIITNFGVWFMGTLYPKTFNGLVEAYFMGVPFFRNTILGDLMYTGIFFSAYELGMVMLPHPLISKRKTQNVKPQLKIKK